MESLLKNSTGLGNRQRNVSLWRPSSLLPAPKLNGNESTALVSFPATPKKRKYDKSWKTIVRIVLVEAKCPPHPDDGASHYYYCKFRLGSEKFKSKSVRSSQQPEWRERFQFHIYQEQVLQITLCDKGKMKNNMGSCTLDLSTYEKERTHEIWQKLDHGYGTIHLSVTMCDIRSEVNDTDDNDCAERHGDMTLPEDWNVVGLLHVNVICAKGLTSKPNAYCTLQIDNERVETPRAGSTTDPKWNKCYIFKIYDVTSTLDFKVYDSSVTNVLNDSLGKVSIPLLRITNGGTRWYALKDRNKRSNARGNCPRVLLKMDMVWNPVKATLKLFQAKEIQHIKKPEKFDIALIYSNMKYISDLLELTAEVNEYYKRLFEWEDTEFSFFVLIVFEVFCFYLRLWTIPLMILLPFIYFRIFNRYRDNIYITSDCSIDDGLEKYTQVASKRLMFDLLMLIFCCFGLSKLSDYIFFVILEPFKLKQKLATLENVQEQKSFTGRLQDLHKMTFTIKNGIEFIVSYIERLFHLVSFRVPFMSYVSMALLTIASIALYLIPFNYILMSLGIYKFTRKYLKPDRVLNNDLIDFLSRVPDNEILKDWKELGVPEPNTEYNDTSLKRPISTST